ncbi:MAG: trypsin-like peptidase domain-containing protein [Sphingobacteriaceae bacterium]|nr:trypsin-like peptidase domain-containing protein [Sphingobacteriaceae bacterium]
MRNSNIFDKYLQGKLNSEEQEQFEERLQHDEIFSKAFREHASLINTLKSHGKSKIFKSLLKSIHEKEYAGQAKIISIHHQPETFGKRAGRTAMVAASAAIIAVLSTITILSTGGYFFKQQSNQITELGLKLKATNEGIVEGLTRNTQKTTYAPANLEGSAFALNNSGYIVTSLHMIKGADSVFVENKLISRTNTKVLFTDAKLDLAVLKIERPEVFANWQVPFNFSEKNIEVGEKVFTLGFPRKDIVYGEGSLSSNSGYNNDTCMYQVSIPVNPGNSGGPLCDENGNIVGVIRGKITGAEGTSFAIKSAKILQSIRELSADTIIINSIKKSGLKGIKRAEQLKRMNPYIFNVLVYKAE